MRISRLYLTNDVGPELDEFEERLAFVQGLASAEASATELRQDGDYAANHIVSITHI